MAGATVTGWWFVTHPSHRRVRRWGAQCIGTQHCSQSGQASDAASAPPLSPQLWVFLLSEPPCARLLDGGEIIVPSHRLVGWVLCDQG